MKANMEECLDAVSKCIEWYRLNKNAPPAKLVELSRVITTNLYVLETYRSEYKKTHDQLVYTYVNESNSVSQSVNMADVEVPELYMLRRIMDAAYKVVDSLRTHISFLKQEMNNLN